MGLTEAEQAVIALARSKLTDGLRAPCYRGHPNPMRGHCYVASEAVFHVLGGRGAGYRPMRVEHEADSHWFLDGPNGRIDATADQFATPVPYERARRAAFLTVGPSRRARILMHRMRAG